MDFFDFLLQAGLVTTGFVAYLIFFRSKASRRGPYLQKGWSYPLKYLFARYIVWQWKRDLPAPTLDELCNEHQKDGYDSVTIRASHTDGTVLYLAIKKWCGRKPTAEVVVYVRLPDGTEFQLPRHPDTAIGAWISSEDSWSAGDLKIQVLEPQQRLRILYNGLLRKVADGAIQHVRINLVWTAGSDVVTYPHEWSSSLAAAALAADEWRTDDWPQMLNRWGDGSWQQWGCVQGRITSYNQGVEDASAWVQCRGSRVRAWSPHGDVGVHRTVALTLVARDGTMVDLRAKSYHNVLTQVYYGFVRYPNFEESSIVSTDLNLADFSEHRNTKLPCYTINVSTSLSSLRLLVRATDAGSLLTGSPYQLESFYSTVTGCIDGEPASGLLELGYEPREVRLPLVPLSPAPALYWTAAGQVSAYCVTFAAPAARDPAVVGGKGASLALLASVQEQEGYKVPDGFCITTNALEKHLATNPDLKQAILDIEPCNLDYNENVFTEKCKIASNMFSDTQLDEAVKEEILDHLRTLRKTAAAAGNLESTSELCFAVRSSGVGEDGVALSAAGQNDTLLGVSTDDDVLHAVLKCWASMFAFNSVQYRRANGQPCLCGGGVVVQRLVHADVAGVLFTRHPQHGDPSRLLITANYGLGESVVSGSVEPDTFVVDRLSPGYEVLELAVGGKGERVVAGAGGARREAVGGEERGRASLSSNQVARLAELGARQETLWAAPRDLEWAIVNEEIYLVQARPITSLERWSEEELLHEMDSAFMSDDELTTFANVGEVMPKPISPLSHDLMIAPLSSGMETAIMGNFKKYEQLLCISHYRGTLDLLKSVYRNIPAEIDIGVRMTEMAIHGHPVADAHIYDVALRRHPPSIFKKPLMILNMLKPLILSRRHMDAVVVGARNLPVDRAPAAADALLQALADSRADISDFCRHHSATSSASTSSQLIAMAVLLEGATDFSPQHCSDIGLLLSGGEGGAVSAGVPRGLAHLARLISASPRCDEFRALPSHAAMAWLQENEPHIYKEVHAFLDEHGHRAIMEFDLATRPWVLEPAQLLELLQGMRAPPEREDAPAQLDDNLLVNSLQTPQKPSTKRILRWVVGLCRRRVVHREGTKAALVRALHAVRAGALRLAAVLQARWLLPRPDLVFYFRLHELQRYVRTRDPKLLRKAIQRRQYFPSWSALRFPELNLGWPAAEAPCAPRLRGAGARLAATPVCGGDVVARACVVTDLAQIGELQAGDVLVTQSTDIGWSPYFPLLAGVVTELGGLISHGAVIARECGLPCIVGAAGATQLFQTGDLVRLSGSAGILEKVQRADDDEVNEDTN